MGPAGTKRGGLGLFSVRVGLGQGGGRWEPGVEEGCHSHARRAPGLHANLRKWFLGARDLRLARPPLSPPSRPSPLCWMAPDKQLAVSGQEQSPLSYSQEA